MDTVLRDSYDWFEEIDDETKEYFELDDILYDISMKIFNYRIENNLKQNELAKKLNISQGMISKLESGEYNPTVQQLWKISKKLDLKLFISLEKKTRIEEEVADIWELKRQQGKPISIGMGEEAISA